jgi:hypothetical protein
MAERDGAVSDRATMRRGLTLKARNPEPALENDETESIRGSPYLARFARSPLP